MDQPLIIEGFVSQRTEKSITVKCFGRNDITIPISAEIRNLRYGDEVFIYFDYTLGRVRKVMTERPLPEDHPDIPNILVDDDCDLVESSAWEVAPI